MPARPRRSRKRSMALYNINGEFVDSSAATINIHDLIVLRGYGAFDFLRTYNGVPFHLKEHLLRLEKSLRLLDLTLDISLEELEERVLATLAKNNFEESNVRIVVSGGISESNLMPEAKGEIIVMVTPLHRLPAHYYTDGVKIITAQHQRFLPGAKSINYIPAILIMKEAKAQGAIEALYTNESNYLLEGTTSNFFCVIDGQLITPPEASILPGITRDVVIEVASKVTDVLVRDIHIDEIRLMDEAIITASNKEIIPVTKINSVTIGDGKPGSLTQELMRVFRDYTRNYPN